MTLLLQHRDSPYIRGVGFLYLRYSCDPSQVWKWIQPYLYDQEPLQVQVNASKQEAKAHDTVGSFVRFLFSERNYHGTMLPRWPIQIERDIQVNLLQAEKIEVRAKQHASKPHQMIYFKTLGSKVQALYGDDENPLRWYDAVVDRVITKDEETNQVLRFPKFLVTFPEYGNTEIVTLGEMDMPGVNSEPFERNAPFPPSGEPERSRNDNRGYASQGYDQGQDTRRGYDERGGRASGSRERDSLGGEWRGSARASGGAYPPNDLYEEVRRRERETVTTSGRNGATRRPPSTKSSMTSSNKDIHVPDRQRDHRTNSRSPSASRVPPQSRSSRSNSKTPPPSPPPRKRTSDEMAANHAKKQKLLAKYG
jgi:pre-mRNA-splicing factor 38B